MFSNNCGLFNDKDVGKDVHICGWVDKLRFLKNIIFIHLRDRTGIIQLCVFKDNCSIWNISNKLTNESCIKICGKLCNKITVQENLIDKFEVHVNNIEILNYSKLLPININVNNSEKVKLKYRYLYLRRLDMYNVLKTRSEIKFLICNFFNKNGFIDVETPFLTKSFPEGAKSYFIHSRVHKDKYYSLPQSPQIFKQLLMISGLERYYQIVKCFRDEDLRSNRQPEFTQIDFELSFAKFKDIKFLVEKLICKLWLKFKNVILPNSFIKMNYFDAINNYGTDKPDLRNPIKFDFKISIFFKNIFSDFLKKKNIINIISIVVTNDIKEVNFDFFLRYLKSFNINFFFYIKVISYIKGKYLYKIYSNLPVDDGLLQKFIFQFNISINSFVFVMFCSICLKSSQLTKIRNFFCNKFNFFKKNSFYPLWVVNFPMFYYDNLNNINVYHHPFTKPLCKSLNDLKSIVDYSKLFSSAYDLVINGYELGSGSVRICNSDIQLEIFNILGIGFNECIKRYGFFLDALKYGTPPHLGMALGLDRIVMLLMNINNIKDVIAFPKTTSGFCLLTGAPD